MKKLKNIFFMLLIAMTAMCSAVYAEPAASPDAAAETAVQTEATAAPEAEPTEEPEPEETVAPELTDNQVEVKAGATELIFTVKHSDTVEISIITPSDVVIDTSSANVTTKSVAGGTEVRIAEPETGIWTMNASSESGEAVTVKGECAYNFVVELQSETGAVIYSGVSNKFIGFIRSKDGSTIDPDVLRTATMQLNIFEEGSSEPKDVKMTFKGAAFEVSYTHDKVERIAITATATINDIDVESEALDIISIVDPNEGGGFPIWAIILIVVAATGAGVYLYIKFADRIKSSASGKNAKNMTGNITINISVNGSDKLPISRNLAMLGQSVGMLTLIGDDEYYDVDGITLSGSDKGVKVVNKSRCDVRFSNAGADPNGVTIIDDQYFRIFMPDEKTIVTVTYHSDDIFAGLMNAAAAEQQKKMEEDILRQQAAAVTAEEIFKEFDKPAETPAPAEETATPSEEAAAPAEEVAPALESLNLSEATEDATPEVQAEETVEVSDEAVEEMPAFTVDTTDVAEETPAPAEEEDYTPEAAPALESLDFSSLTEDAAPEVQAEEVTEAVEEAPAETASFTIDTTDAVEIEAPVEEDYTPEVAPALESFSFSFDEAETDTEAADDDKTVVIEDTAEDTEVADDDKTVVIEDSTSSMFGDLASLANAVASEADSEPVQNDESGISFSELASLVADVATAEPEADDDATVIMDDGDDLFNLQNLADELTKED